MVQNFLQNLASYNKAEKCSLTERMEGIRLMDTE